MTTETTVTRFAIGSEVPAWLIDQEPIHAQSTPGVFRFTTPCDVIDTPEYFVVIPIVSGPLPSIIDFDGGGVRIFASGKPVRLVCAQQTFLAPEIDGWSHTLPFLDQHPPAPAAPVKVSLWKWIFG